MLDERKFISESEYKDYSRGWRQAADAHERKDEQYSYTVDRAIVGHDSAWGVGETRILHSESFEDLFKRVQHHRLGAGREAQKTRILILSDGIGIGADTIRKKYRDTVLVMSTGLRKEKARRLRRSLPGAPTGRGLHKNDLQWRSILELRDEPEFDIIFETYGEVSHDSSAARSGSMEPFVRKVGAIAEKLLPGGAASIAPVYPTALNKIQGEIVEICKQNNVQIMVEGIALKIDKLLLDK